MRADLATKLLKLTGSFEGGGLAGDFDGQILSFGPLQWNLGQGTLQPLLRRALELDPRGFREAMATGFVMALRTDEALESFVRGHVLSYGRPRLEWRRRFARLAALPACERACAEAAKPYLERAERDATRLGFRTERGLALCFDVAVQNGGVRAEHERRYRARGGHVLPMEWARLKAMAHAVADSANPQWRDDVLSRKLTCALGRGTVHGRAYDLEQDFGLSYARAWRSDD